MTISDFEQNFFLFWQVRLTLGWQAQNTLPTSLGFSMFFFLLFLVSHFHYLHLFLGATEFVLETFGNARTLFNSCHRVFEIMQVHRYSFEHHSTYFRDLLAYPTYSVTSCSPHHQPTTLQGQLYHFHQSLRHSRVPELEHVQPSQLPRSVLHSMNASKTRSIVESLPRRVSSLVQTPTLIPNLSVWCLLAKVLTGQYEQGILWIVRMRWSRRTVPRPCQDWKLAGNRPSS
jgi:hypothetical protein